MSDPWGVSGWMVFSQQRPLHRACTVCQTRGLSGEHPSHGAVLREKYRLRGGEKKIQLSKRTRDLLIYLEPSVSSTLVETEPGPGHAAASQIAPLHSLCQVGLLMIIHSRNHPPAV